MAKYTLVGTAKNEGPFLLEWLAYHYVIGFDQFHVSANDCTDHTDDILRLLHTAGIVIFNDNHTAVDDEPADPQRRAYVRARRNKDVFRSDYVAVLDLDEFLNITVGNGLLVDLFRATGQFDILSATWRVFGANGVVQFQDRYQIEQFTQSVDVSRPPTRRFWGLKSIFDPRVTGMFGIHRPRLPADYRHGVKGPLTWLNGSGRDVYDAYFAGKWASDHTTFGNDIVQVNHYMVRSAEAFLLKRLRGTANSADQDRINFEYFEAFNVNEQTDTSIQHHIPAVRAQVNAWVEQVPGLATLHEKSVDYHKAKIAEQRASLWKTDPGLAASMGFTV